MTDSATHPIIPSGCTRWLAALTVLLTIIHIGAAWRTLQTPPDLAVVVNLPLPLEFAAGVTWGLLSALVTITLVRRNPRALHFAGWLLIGLLVYNAARWVIFVRADYDRQRLPFLLALATILLLILTALVLRPAAQPTENSGNGRKSED